jgi:hypothetical protein
VKKKQGPNSVKQASQRHKHSPDALSLSLSLSLSPLSPFGAPSPGVSIFGILVLTTAGRLFDTVWMKHSEVIIRFYLFLIPVLQHVVELAGF